MSTGRSKNGQFIRGATSWHKGKKGVYSVETRRKMSEAKKGKPNWRNGQTGVYKHTPEWKAAQAERSKGHKLSQESRKKIGDANRGERNGQWKGGTAAKDYSARRTYEYRLWRKAVLERDRNCIWCGSEERLEIDHILPFASYPELRLAIDNGRVLCHDCHKKTTTYRRITKS